MPPRLSAAAMFWWGLAAIIASYIGDQILTQVVYSDQVSISPSVNTLISPVLTTLTVLGSTMVVGSFVVRALDRDDR